MLGVAYLLLLLLLRANFEAREYGAGGAAPAKTATVLDIPYDVHIRHPRDGSGSEVSQRRLTSLSQPFGCMNGMPKVVTDGLCTPRHLH